MIREYRTIQEIVSPLMMIKDVEGVTYDELAEIELPDGEVRRCKVLEVDGIRPSSSCLKARQASTSPSRRSAFSGTPWSWPFRAICSGASSTAWASPLTAARKSSPSPWRTSTACP